MDYYGLALANIAEYHRIAESLARSREADRLTRKPREAKRNDDIRTGPRLDPRADHALKQLF